MATATAHPVVAGKDIIPDACLVWPKYGDHIVYEVARILPPERHGADVHVGLRDIRLPLDDDRNLVWLTLIEMQQRGFYRVGS